MSTPVQLEQSRRIDASIKFPPVSGPMLEDIRRQQKELPRTVATPWPSLSRMCRGPGGGQGFALGWHVILGGLTGGGKTLAGLNLAWSALREGIGVMYVTMEMDHATLLTRLRAIVTGGEIMHLEWGSGFNAETAEQADQAILELPGTLLVNTEPIWQLPDIRAAISHAVERDGVRLVIIDYAQLVSPGKSDSALFEKMLAVSAELTFTAKTEGVVIATLTQLNNKSTKERGTEPSLEAVYGGGRLVHDCDLLMMLNYANHKYDPLRRRAETDLIVLKNRHGPAGRFPVELDYRTMRITEFDRSREDWR